jgi:hypothetical protein
MDLFTSGKLIDKARAGLKHTPLADLGQMEKRGRHSDDEFITFCAAKFEINSRGFMCHCCSAYHHFRENWVCAPCSSCKGKKPVPLEDLVYTLGEIVQ